MRFDIFSLFPAMFAGPFEESILKRAQSGGIIEIGVHDIRTWTADKHHTADDTPYGGGAGMVMIAPPIVDAVEQTLGEAFPQARVLLMAAGGRPFTQQLARDLAAEHRIAIICGHYEGIDQRVVDVLGAEEVSIGDYVLTGGELPAMIVVDAVARLVPGVIDEASIGEESHDASLLEYPHYTKPRVFRGIEIPPVLVSGHHAEIAKWRREQSIRRTLRIRPDLLRRAQLTTRERDLVTEIGQAATEDQE
ncbi:MAG: tRNA (guanosine(37)-N1)-methyltransferase TrmD [Thermomicrobiales bacterium]